ncbi:MAG: KOW motif-containing protein, partial [bacterium]
MTLGPTQSEIIVGATVEITGGHYLGRRGMVVKVPPQMVVVHRRHP